MIRPDLSWVDISQTRGIVQSLRQQHSTLPIISLFDRRCLSALTVDPYFSKRSPNLDARLSSYIISLHSKYSLLHHHVGLYVKPAVGCHDKPRCPCSSLILALCTCRAAHSRLTTCTRRPQERLAWCRLQLLCIFGE